MRAHYRTSRLQDWSSRVLGTELLEYAGLAPADRSLRDIARINRWFGGHNALLRMMGISSNNPGSVGTHDFCTGLRLDRHGHWSLAATDGRRQRHLASGDRYGSRQNRHAGF